MRYWFLTIIVLFTTLVKAQEKPVLTEEMAIKLADMPFNCIEKEFPNKTSHVDNSAVDSQLTPKALHPAFYGCFDWHSSVHGHWMLVKLLKSFPNLKDKEKLIAKLNKTLTVENLKLEADYFSKYDLANLYERTYGWAWLLKLDEELYTWDNPEAKKWHAALQPLTQKIVKLWKEYLPKQTYPNRTGVHNNTAFGLVFAYEWARTFHDQAFENIIVKKTKDFYLDNKATPAYMEPDGADFFSPSLEVADLMRRVLPQKEFVAWFNAFYEARSLKRILDLPVVSDINDYQGVHLVGLSFTRAWCLKGVAQSLPKQHKLKVVFNLAGDKFLNNALPLVFNGNYGGDHWLASFAVYALAK